ncbi:unnamed protein product [Ectocarpus sp. 6 AP-2014]
MERHAYQEEIVAAAAEEQAVVAIHQQRLQMAKTLLNKHNPSWFADMEGHGKTTTDAAQVEDVKHSAAAAAAKQRAAAMALLKEHNADWFGDDKEARKQKKSIFRRVKDSRKMRKNDSLTSRERTSSAQADKSQEKAVLKGTLARLTQGTSSGRIRSESPPSLIVRSVSRLGRKSPSGEHQVAPGSVSSGQSEGYRKSSWFSRHSRSPNQQLSSYPTSPVGMVHGQITARSCTTPVPPPPLMDILENTAEEPMSLRSMLRFARENLMEENVLFYLEVVSFKTGGGGRCEYLTTIKRIHELYIQHNSKREVNISGQIRSNTMATVEAILSADGRSSGGSTGAPGDVELRAAGDEVERQPAETNVVEAEGGACSVGAAIRAADEGVEAGAGGCFEAATPAAATPAALGGEAGGGGPLKEAAAATEAEKTVGVEDLDVATAPKLGHADGEEAGACVAEAVIADESQEGSQAPGSLPLLGPFPTQSPTHKAIVSGNSNSSSSSSSSSSLATESVTPAAVEEERERDAADNAASAGRFTVLGKCRSDSPSSKGISSSNSSSSSRDGEQDGDTEEEIRLRRDSTMWDDRCLHSADLAAEDDFNASVEIEMLGLGIGPGGGYGDRTIFDSALLEASAHLQAGLIFVILRHEVYPKFVTRVANSSTCHSSASSTTVRTATLSAASIPPTTLGTPVKPIEASRVSLSQSEEVAKARRFPWLGASS